MPARGFLIFSLVSVFALSAQAKPLPEDAKSICDEAGNISSVTVPGKLRVRAVPENKNSGPKCMVEDDNEFHHTPCEQVFLNAKGKVICEKNNLNFQPGRMKINLDCSRGDKDFVAEYVYVPPSEERGKFLKHKIRYRQGITNKTGKPVNSVDVYNYSYTSDPNELRFTYNFQATGKNAGKYIERVSNDEVTQRNASGTIADFPQWSGYEVVKLANCCLNEDSNPHCKEFTAPPVTAEPVKRKPVTN